MEDFLVDVFGLSDPRNRQRQGTQTTCSSLDGCHGAVLENMTVRTHIIEGRTISQQDVDFLAHRFDVAAEKTWIAAHRVDYGLLATLELLEMTMASSPHWNFLSRLWPPRHTGTS